MSRQPEVWPPRSWMARGVAAQDILCQNVSWPYFSLKGCSLVIHVDQRLLISLSGLVFMWFGGFEPHHDSQFMCMWADDTPVIFVPTMYSYIEWQNTSRSFSRCASTDLLRRGRGLSHETVFGYLSWPPYYGDLSLGQGENQLWDRDVE